MTPISASWLMHSTALVLNDLEAIGAAMHAGAQAVGATEVGRAEVAMSPTA